jgi:uncharacterized membrane protein
MDKDNLLGGIWCVLGIISCILAILVGQYVANYFAFTGIMWWVVAIIAYVVSGAIFGSIVWGITLFIDDHFI